MATKQPHACLLVLALALVVRGGSQGIDVEGKQVEIYGVRWFLGEKYRFQPPITIRQLNQTLSHLLLFFNTHSEWPQYTFKVSINQKAYQCSQMKVEVNITEKHHVDFNQFASKKGEQFTVYIQKCPILFQEDRYLANLSEIPYAIAASTNGKDQQIFSASLRSPSYQIDSTSITVLGDWGVLSNFSKQSLLSQPITPCLMQQISTNAEIKLMLLLGDLAYDLEGRSYVHFFTYLQQFSSRVVILFSPGNHETIKHKDIYQLVKQSFYSPFWSHFYGYFDLVQLGQYVFIGYNTESLFPGLWLQSNSSLFQVQLKDQFKVYYDLFISQLPQQTIARLKQYKVIGYSHYPTFCSQEDHHESCLDYRLKHEPFLQKLEQIGMRMFFSGHLHIYQRSKQVCSLGNVLRGGMIGQGHYEYINEQNCSIFVIEGAAGNNYYVQTTRHFQLQPHSQKFVDNTGFGVLTLRQDYNSTQYRHIIADGCEVADDVILWDSQLARTTNQIKQFTDGGKAHYLIVISAGFILSILIFARIYQKRRHLKLDNGQKLSSKSSTNVLQMIENDH